LALSCCVYVIEDDEEVARSLLVLLRLCGYQALRFASAELFLSHADELPPGCLLTDYSLPGIDGLTLVRTLRERGMRWPAIVMTGHEVEALEREAKRAGVRCVIPKPFDIARLSAELNAVAALVPRRSRRAASLRHGIDAGRPMLPAFGARRQPAGVPSRLLAQ
jgi:two-component system, LuxR family, response regulator FixJ